MADKPKKDKKGKSRYAQKVAKRARFARMMGYPAGTPWPVMGITDSRRRD